MTSPSALSTTLFVGIVAIVAALFCFAVLRVAPEGGRVGRDRWRRIGIPLGILVAYLVIPGVLAGAGLLHRYSPLPAPALLLVGVITAGTMALALSPLGARLAAGIPLAGLVAFQVFRVPLEWLLHRLFSEGVIPVQMTYAGLNFDVISGITAGVIALLLRSGRRSPRLVLAWNILGLLLLANIVTVAVLSTPVPFRLFTNEPANLLPSTFPYIWLPTFLVQMALLGHVVVFRALWSSARR